MYRIHLFNWLWLIGPLGLCRATQVVLHDRILDRPRRWITGEPKLKAAADAPDRRKPLGELVAYLFGCPWCISLELALIVAVLLDNRTTQGPTLLVLLALSLSLVAVCIDRIIDRTLPDEAPPPPPPVAIAVAPPSAVAKAFAAGHPVSAGS